MSQPSFPNNLDITRDDAVNQILSSIAMEELGLSHIINAEGEKLQYVLGTLPGATGPTATIEDLLNTNESIQNLLQNASYNQLLLKSKMQQALSASEMTGAIGPTGPTGPAGETLVAQRVQSEKPVLPALGACGRARSSRRYPAPTVQSEKPVLLARPVLPAQLAPPEPIRQQPLRLRMRRQFRLLLHFPVRLFLWRAVKFFPLA